MEDLLAAIATTILDARSSGRDPLDDIVELLDAEGLDTTPIFGAGSQYVGKLSARVLGFISTAEGMER